MTNNKVAIASYGYESPEISKVYREASSFYHDHLHQSSHVSYGKYVADKDQSVLSSITSFLRPHPSNDMWALGMVLNELLSGTAPYVRDNSQVEIIVRDNEEYIKVFEEKISTNPLLSGLLNPQREQRFTANDAIETFEKRVKYKIK